MTSDNRIYGYIRVSSKDQNLDRQIESLSQYVPDARDIFQDKASGKDMERTGYAALKHVIRRGDTLYIHSLDCLGRNKMAVKNELKSFMDKGIVVRVLDIPTSLEDFSRFGTMQQSIMDMVNNILIEVLATMAENERVNIKTRQREGIAAAHSRNIKFGRPTKDFPAEWQHDYVLWKNKELTAVSLMKKYKMASSTFYKKVGEWEANHPAI